MLKVIDDGVKQMRATIIGNVMGVFSFGEANELVDQILFPSDAKKIAKKLKKIETGEVIKEIVVLIEKLKNRGYASFTFEMPEVAWNTREELGVDVDIVKFSKASEMLRTNLDKFALETGFVKSTAELREVVHNVSMELSRTRVKEAIEKRDLVIIQAIQTLDDLDKTINLFVSRIREWYGLHFPELSRLVDKHETYTRLILNLKKRNKFTVENLEKEGLPEAKTEQIAKIAESSMGAELTEQDLEQITDMCKNILALSQRRSSLEKYIDSAMNDVAPNIRALVGSLLGARLIAIASTLDNLAKMPASTIQVLGAEKALFRSLRTGTRPPKHGIIFQHTIIHEAKHWQRGKVARVFAGKLAIAARIDAYSGKYVGDKLKADLEKRVKEIQEKYEKPPTPKRIHAKRKSGRTKRGRKR